MKAEPAMPLTVGDYLQDTMGLTRQEHGSYMLLIMAYWANGGPLKNDDCSLKTIARCPDSEWARTKGIMEQFFDSSNGVWKHKRIDSELEKSKRRTAIAMMGVQARRESGSLPAQPPVQPSVKPTVSPSVQAINNRAELERVEKRMVEIRNLGSKVAGGQTIYSAPQKAELSALKDRKKQLLEMLGFRA